MSFSFLFVLSVFSRLALTLSSHLVHFNFPLRHSLPCVPILYWYWQHPSAAVGAFWTNQQLWPAGPDRRKSSVSHLKHSFPSTPPAQWRCHGEKQIWTFCSLLWEWSVWSSLWSPAGLMSTLMHRSHPSGLMHCALGHRGVNGAAAECPCLQFTAIWGRPRSLPQRDKD